MDARSAVGDDMRALDRIEMEILAWRGLTPDRTARFDALYERVCGPGSPEDALALDASAWAVEAVIHGERWERAEPLSARGLALHERRLGPDHPDLLAPLLARALVLAHLDGRAGEAEALLRRALALRPEPTGGARIGWARAQQLLADLLDARGEKREAGELYGAAAAGYEATIGLAQGLALHCWIRYGERALGSDPGEVRATLGRVLEDLGERARDVPLAAAILRRLRGSALTLLGSFDEAEIELGRAEDLIAYIDVPQFLEERRRVLAARVELYAAWPAPEKLAQAQAKLAEEPAAPAEK
jgi:tetratricopeptide (TPR) repeat protein